MPPNAGSAKVMESKENIVLDLSLAKMGNTSTSKGNKMHPWQCYITDNQPSSVKLKINEYSCLMKGQSAHMYFSGLTWVDRITPTDFSEEFTHTSEMHVIYLRVKFDSQARMVLVVDDNPKIFSGPRWVGFSNYENPQNTFIDAAPTEFYWYQLLAYWEATTGDMVQDATFSGSPYTLRCPTTTHIKEGIERGILDGDFENIVDYCCLKPWFGCIEGS